MKNKVLNNKGDVYIQTLICTVILLFVGLFIASIATAISDKLWIDEQLDEISTLVSSTGCVKGAAITEKENMLKNRFGGTISYTATYVGGDATKGRVQLNDTVLITYHVDSYVAFNISGIKIATPISLTRLAMSQVYFKTSADLVD